jgi:hypothetical protein
MDELKRINIRCPECGESYYQSFDENYDDEWIALFCACLACKTKFVISYRAVEIDKLPDNWGKRNCVPDSLSLT